ncbi:uncharacterized protein LAESUDRAFT_341809 [Laetiporus sulphureus 93-53]|uniref:Uncharacterized protein n=1 Tax=Laetiporus sulphureus 93-53 TaxID=1314785 RepID=A0A165GPK1_9APHY|nr:uncharacterized protein LAESUDRAFT_341809 [Laetiporus sulphureus 93-53]KZT10631.1 hypothetical protein LAESUDRAFT_341809 [Laetiporus sulphureus 93-53]
MMSTLDVRDPIKSHMLRSATPGSNEKGMSKYPPDDDKASSIRSSVSRLRSPLSNGASRLDELPEERDNGDGGDIRSDVQEGNGSDIMRTIPVHTTGPPEHEPGPNDPPGPHFESYGSSFGNFGPLPAEGAVAPPLSGTAWNAQNAPTKNGMPLPASSSDSHPNPFQQFGMTPVVATGIPLPATMASAAEIPSSPAMSRSRMNGSRASNKSPPPADFNAVCCSICSCIATNSPSPR